MITEAYARHVSPLWQCGVPMMMMMIILTHCRLRAIGRIYR